jgi:hypothetical protein
MTLTVEPDALFTGSLDLGAGMTGLVGTLGVRLVDPGVQEVPIPFTKSGISEDPAGSGIYGVELRAPSDPGMFVLMWDTTNGTGPYTVSNSWGEQVIVAIEDPVFPGGWSWTPFGWLQPDWYDSNQWDISTGDAGSNPVPTAADVRAASKLDFDDYGYPVSQDGLPGGLQEVVNQAESAFYRITGQSLDRIDTKDAPLVRRVITGLTQQMAMQNSEDYLDTTSDWDLIVSFSAGPYSETRRSAVDMFQARMLNPVPWLSSALWSLLSEERYGYYMAFFTGYNMPAFQTSDVFWEEGLWQGELGRPDGIPGGYYWGA